MLCGRQKSSYEAANLACSPGQGAMRVRDYLTNSRSRLAMSAVPGLLVLFGRRGNARAAEFVGIIFPEEHVPLFAALENFFFLRGDFLADFHFDLFFLAKNVGH